MTYEQAKQAAKEGKLNETDNFIFNFYKRLCDNEGFIKIMNYEDFSNDFHEISLENKRLRFVGRSIDFGDDTWSGDSFYDITTAIQRVKHWLNYGDHTTKCAYILDIDKNTIYVPSQFKESFLESLERVTISVEHNYNCHDFAIEYVDFKLSETK